SAHAAHYQFGPVVGEGKLVNTERERAHHSGNELGARARRIKVSIVGVVHPIRSVRENCHACGFLDIPYANLTVQTGGIEFSTIRRKKRTADLTRVPFE